MLAISAAALGGKDDVSVRTMQLKVQLQGLNLTVLVDSGSTHSFLDTSLASKLQDLSPLQRVSVKMANGATVSCHQQLLSGMWSCSGHKFSCDFKLFPLGSYDGIIGLDWLSAHSPMLVDWENHWLSFSHMGSEITLLGSAATLPQIAMLHFCSLLTTENLPILPEVQSVLDQFKEVFEPPTGLPPRRAYDHTIPLIPGAAPVALRPYRIAPALKTELERQIQDMLASGVIRPSNNPFSSPLLMVKKKDESWRPVIDYRHLNAITVKGKFPIRVIDELLDELGGAGWFTKLDLRSGYHHIRLAPGEEYKTAFQTHLGHYEFLVVSFGLTGGPNTFQFAMNHTLAPGNRKYVIVFFDDILVFSITFKEHLQHLRLVLSMLAKHQWKVKLSKCAFAQRQVGYLGHIISSAGVSTDPTKITAIDTWPTPANVKEVRGFLGLAGYYRKFICHYGIICRSLTNLLKKGTVFRWSDIEDSAFRTLKQALVTAPVLALPDFNKTFVIATDACDVGIGAVLMQDDHPLAYVSKALGPRNRALSVYEKEFLAILLAVEHWRQYLLFSEFIIQTNQRSLTSLSDQRLHTPWQQKALTKLMGLRYTIQYRKGSDNNAADALSRRPHTTVELQAVSSACPAWFPDIVASYQNDAVALKRLKELSEGSPADSKFSLKNGLLCTDGCIWVGADSELQNKIVDAFHSSPLGGHSGFPVTYKRIRLLFRWTGMKAFIKQVIQCRLVCQQAKPERVPYPGLLQPLPVPNLPWEMVTMDFIEGLPQSGRYNCILVVIDKLSKYGHFIPLHHPFTVQTVAEAFLDSVYKLHGMPLSIVSDRDRIFTSQFWKEMFQHVQGTQLRMSSARHPQTDGQTERVNQQIECYLRCFVSTHPSKWSKWLSLCEYWYNTNWHSATAKSPFEIIYGHSPRHFGIAPDCTIASSDLSQWLEQRQVIFASVKQQLLRAQQRMKAQSDKHRTERSFSMGDQVFLKLQPYIQESVAPRANHKLAYKFFGPYTILERVGEVAYRLDLPNTSKVHPVFHVSLLRKVLKPTQQVLPCLPSPESAVQVPEKILQKRVIHRNDKKLVQVLLQWSGDPVDLATWEDFEAIKQKFPRAPAWGQAVSHQGGIVSDKEQGTQEVASNPRTRPIRKPRLPSRLAGPEWALGRIDI